MTLISGDQGPRPDSTRVFVQLSSGTRILVPVPQQSTVLDLHQKALQRAAGVGIRGTLQDTVLETTGGSTPPVALTGEDQVLDILDLTEDNTFSLRSVNPGQEYRDHAAPGPSSPGPTPSGTNSALASGKAKVGGNEDVAAPADDGGLVYVRWITIDAAVKNSRLNDISVDDAGFPSDTSLAEFYRAAKERLCSQSPRGSCTNPQSLNLYLESCALSAENNPASLADLGLEGKYSEPLDIFVEFVGPEHRGTLQQLSEKSNPQTLWSFDSTNRGICTLVTSLQILLEEIERGHCTLDGIHKVLLELTHFPPLLLAFSEIHHRRLQDLSDVGPFLLLASGFHALCKKLAPVWICPTSNMALEASRQLIAWMFSIHSSERKPCLVHRVQIRQPDASGLVASAMPHVHDFDLPQATKDSAAGSSTQKVHVGLDEDDEKLSRMLCLAISDKYSDPWDFYFKHPTTSWKEFLGHWLMPTLDQKEFHHLLETTNSISAFRMVGPQQLGKCLAAEIPVITLSDTGYVSRYDQEDYACAEKRYYIWNALEKKVNLPDLDSAQYLSHKLEPIIAERKKDQTWELDSWAQWDEAETFGPPDEAVVICVDISGSMNSEMPSSWTTNPDKHGHRLSRLTEVKEFFKNLTLRISALNLSTHLGLVTFSDTVTELQPLTPLHLNIHHKIEHLEVVGTTAIIDAVSHAADMLKGLKERFPKTRCRIILLTDGEDNKSETKPLTASLKLYDNDIVLDTVVIGTDRTADLFKMARMTGGYAFAPKLQQALFQIFLLETVVDIRTRPDPVKVALENKSWYTFSPKAADMSDPYDFPPCRPHPHMEDYFIALRDAERFLSFLSRKPQPSFETVLSESIRFSMPTSISSHNAGSGNTSNARILMNEVKAMIEHPHDFMDVYVSESNMGFWKVVLQGPPASAYQEGVFLLYIEIGPEFPRKPPAARFVTPVLHPNITKHGRICHPIFDREWTPQTRIYQVLQHLYGILMSLEARDAVDPLSALRFWTDAVEGRREVQNYITRFAYRTRAQLRAEITGDDVSTIASSDIAPSYHTNDPDANAPIVINPNTGPGSDGDCSPVSPPPSYRSNPPSVLGTGSIRRPAAVPSHSATQRRPPAGGRRLNFFGKLKNSK